MTMSLDPLLTAALRARAATDPALENLLSGLDPSSGGGAVPSTQELLSQLESTNPTIGMITKYLAARQESEREMNSNEADVQEDPEAACAAEEQRLAIEQYERLAQIVQRLMRHVAKMRSELEQLRERNDTLAFALGACYLCWGEDAGCPACHGIGRVGAFMPDKPLLAQFVAPAVRVIQSTKEADQVKSNIGRSDASTQAKAKKGE